jgi:hypothetical protein
VCMSECIRLQHSLQTATPKRWTQGSTDGSKRCQDLQTGLTAQHTVKMDGNKKGLSAQKLSRQMAMRNSRQPNTLSTQRVIRQG